MQQIKLIDIFGNKQSESTNINNVISNSKTKKIFPKIDINIGLNNNQLQSDSVLIHRLLQKKLLSNLEKNTVLSNKISSNLETNIQKFMRILINEMKTKQSNYDINLITRDTLLEYYVK